MDSATATLTSAIVTLALEAARETAGTVARDTWARIKQLLGWEAEPPVAEMAARVAVAIEKDENLAATALKILESKGVPPDVSHLVSSLSVQGGRIVVQNVGNNFGTINTKL